MNLLISGVGGSTPRSIVRSIKISKYADSTTVYGTDVNPFAHGMYENELYQGTQLIPCAEKEGYWESLQAYINKNNISCAMVHPEQEVLVWSKLKKQGGEWPCQTLLPDYDVVKVLVDKGAMTEILDGTGLVPESFLINPKNLHFEDLENALPYPFWIRSTTGSSGLGSLKIENQDSFKNWITINPRVTEFIASTYLPGRNLACKLLYYNGKLLRSACGERVNYIMAKVAPSGITGNTSFGRLINEPRLVDVAVKAMDLIFNATGAPKHGFFTADFKEDVNGKPYITEINVRMVAFNYCFALGGANFTEDIISLLTDPDSFDFNYKMYEFEPGTIFLRDVDSEPILMNEKNLKSLE